MGYSQTILPQLYVGYNFNSFTTFGPRQPMKKRRLFFALRIWVKYPSKNEGKVGSHLLTIDPNFQQHIQVPAGSMYGIFTYIYHKVNPI